MPGTNSKGMTNSLYDVNPGGTKLCIIFQIIAPPNSKDNEDDINESKIKIFKMIGKNLLVLRIEYYVIYCREKDCPRHLPSLCCWLLEL